MSRSIFPHEIIGNTGQGAWPCMEHTGLCTGDGVDGTPRFLADVVPA